MARAPALTGCLVIGQQRKFYDASLQAFDELFIDALNEHDLRL